MRYFPLDGTPFALSPGALSLGVRPLLHEPLLDPDPHQLQLKNDLLRRDPHFHAQALPGTEALRAEVGELLGLPGDLAEVATQVAEDLLVLSDAPGWPLVAGVLCFPNDWCLADKLGRSLFAVHAPVPGFAAQVGDSTLKLFDKLKPGRPVWRANWAVKVTSRLDLPPHINATFEAAKLDITAANAAQRCFFRIERQTLSRLPRTGAILFTVRTYVAPLAELSPTERQALAVALRTLPPALLAYKGIAPYAQPLLEFLESS